MFGNKAFASAAMVMLTTVGTVGTAVATAEPTDPHAHNDLKVVLSDYRSHVGERFEAHGLVYANAAAWTLAFLTDEPSEFYTIDGARAEIAGPAVESIRQGDIFTGTISITGKAGIHDPEVLLEDVRVIGHQP